MKKVIQSIKPILKKLAKNPFPLFGILIATPGLLVFIHLVRSDMPYDQRTYYVILSMILVYIGWCLVKVNPDEKESGIDVENVRKQLLQLSDEERRELLTQQSDHPEVIKYYEKLNRSGNLYTVDEAAQILGISMPTAYRAIKRGEIPSMRIGRRIKIPIAVLKRKLDEIGIADE